MVLARQFPTAEFDRALVMRARQGDQDAFAELMHEYGAVVRRLVFRFVQDTDDARDVEQDTWIRAATQLDSLRDEGRFRPWLKSIARHSALNFIAARKNQRARVSTFEACGTEDFEDTDIESPERHAMSLDNQRKVWEALGSLSERDRQALFMREYQDLPYTQIAERLGISRNAAEVCVFRARDRFRRLFVEVEERTQDCGMDPLRLSALVDAAVDGDSLETIRAHIQACQPCEERLVTMQAGQALYRNLGMFGFPLTPQALLGTGGLLAQISGLVGKIVSLVTGGSGAATAAGSGAGGAAATTAVGTTGAVTAGGTVAATAAATAALGGSVGAIPAIAGAVVVAVSSVVATGALTSDNTPPPAATPTVVASAPVATATPTSTPARSNTLVVHHPPLAATPEATPVVEVAPPPPAPASVVPVSTPEPVVTPEPTPEPPPAVTATPVAKVQATPSPTPTPQTQAPVVQDAPPPPPPAPTPAPETPREEAKQSVAEAKVSVAESADEAEVKIEEAAEEATEKVKTAETAAKDKVAKIETKNEAAKQVVVVATEKIEGISTKAQENITQVQQKAQEKVAKVEERSTKVLDRLDRVADRVGDSERGARMVGFLSHLVAAVTDRRMDRIADRAEHQVDGIATTAATEMDATATQAEVDAAAANEAGEGDVS